MKYLLRAFLLLPLFIISCQTKQTKNELLILGNWKQVASAEETNLTFNADSSFRDLSGFYKLSNNHKLNYLGSSSKYKIVQDTLLLYLPDSAKWEKQFILNLTKDSLRLKRSNDTITLTHYQPVIANNPAFDKIIISYQSDRRNGDDIDIYLDIDGNVMYRNMATIRPQFYWANISKTRYHELLNNFAQVNIKTLMNNYYSKDSTHTERTDFNITFSNNNNIFKSVKDYGGFAPLQFISAYQPLIYLGDSLNLKPLKLPDYLRNLETLDDIKFENGLGFVSLSRPEMILLFHYLKSGKTCSTSFKKRFNLKMHCFYFPQPNVQATFKFDKYHDRGDIPPVATDGRYFTFTINGKPNTIDIGFNFFDVNSKHWTWEKQHTPV